MKQRETQIPVAVRRTRLTQALRRLIDFYTAWDKPDEAAKWRKSLDEYSPANQSTANATEKP